MKQLFYYMLPLLLGLTSCIDDDFNKEGSLMEGEALVTFSLKVPGGSIPKTYALTGTDENRIKTIDILVFGTDGAYKDTRYVEATNLTNVDPNPEINDKQTFTVKLAKGTCDLVLLANSRDIINAAFPAGITQGTTKATVMAALKKGNVGRWSDKTTDDSYLMPMWGEKENITISEATSFTGANSVKMVRMMVKIDVALTAAAATDNFKITDIFLRNRNTQGYLVPNTTATYWDAASSIALKPNPVASVRDQLPLKYSEDDGYINTPKVSSMGEIYTFESEVPYSNGNVELDKVTCLVIGGYYGAGNNTEKTYYRIDFANKVGNTWVYVNLLRNHKYKVNITKVSGRGFATEKEAWEARPVNIEANILEWNEGLFTEVTTDGQYTLAVSKSEFTLNKDATTPASTDNKVLVRTDYPKGWTVSKIVDTNGTIITDWLTASPATGVANENIEMALNLTANATAANRIGYVHITAGRIDYVIKVIQTTQAATTWSALTNPTPATDGVFSATVDGASTNYEGSDATGTAILEISSYSPHSNATKYTVTYTSNPGVSITVAKTETFDGTQYVAVYKISVPVQTIVIDTKIVFADVADPSNKREVVIKVANPFYPKTKLKSVLYKDTYWAPVNVGATTDDATTLNEASLGRMYQWGRNNISWAPNMDSTPFNDTHSGSVSYEEATGIYASNFIIPTKDGNGDWLTTSNPNLWLGDNPTPCPTGFRLPTKAELTTLKVAFSNVDATTHRLVLAGTVAGTTLYLPSRGGKRSTVVSALPGQGEMYSPNAYIYYWGVDSTITSISKPVLSISTISSIISIGTQIASNGIFIRCVRK